jgi:GNAT superfamily N-acetyltransferase
VSLGGRTDGAIARLSIRPAAADELGTCADVHRAATNEYTARLGQPEMPPDTTSVVRLFGHLHSTDPNRFIVATVPSAGSDAGRIVAFASAYVRENLWYLSMLFVLPEFQGAGLGRRLLAQVDAVDPSMTRAVATDSAQPISNALYASMGLVPRMPLFNLTGLPRQPEMFGALPSGVVPIAFADIATGGPDGQGHRMLADAIDELDRTCLGVAHPIDHRLLRMEDRHGWLYRGPDGTPIGYGYAGEAGRVGPIAAVDPSLVSPVIGHLTTAVVPRGAFAMWIGGAADHALTAALQAGFRIDTFPVLMAWDRPFADFARYMPRSPGLL